MICVLTIVDTERGFFCFLRRLEFGRIGLNSKESVYYSVAICLEALSQKSKYCSWKAPAKETF